MMLTPIGWIAVHALWQATLIAGVTALALGLLRNARAQARYLAACIGLAAMAAVMLATIFVRTTPAIGRMRRGLMPAVDTVVDMPTVIYWASMAVPIAGALWLAGVALWLLRLAVAFRRVRAIRRDTRDAPQLPALSGVEGPGDVDVRCSPRVHVPMVLGWYRPLVLLPAQALAALSEVQVRAILAHEFAHVRRRDYAVNVFVILAEGLLFYHPAARWVASRIRMEREFCCDDEAIAVAGDRATYARALAALEDTRSGCTLAVAASSGTLLDRISRIVNGTKPSLTPLGGGIALMTASVVAAALLALSMAVPPGLPWAAVMKRRMPPPPGVSLGAERLNGVDPGSAPRRKISGQERDAR